MQIILSEVELDSMMVASATIGKLESKFINDQVSEVHLGFEIDATDWHTWTQIPQEMDEIASVLSGISPILGQQDVLPYYLEGGNQWIK